MRSWLMPTACVAAVAAAVEAVNVTHVYLSGSKVPQDGNDVMLHLLAVVADRSCGAALLRVTWSTSSQASPASS
jgi:hypothetical protein